MKLLQYAFLSFQGIGGAGRSSACKLAAFMGDYDLYQIEVSKNYGFNEWREDIQKLFRQAGIAGTSTVFLFGDHQIKVNFILVINTKSTG